MQEFIKLTKKSSRKQVGSGSPSSLQSPNQTELFKEGKGQGRLHSLMNSDVETQVKQEQIESSHL